MVLARLLRDNILLKNRNLLMKNRILYLIFIFFMGFTFYGQSKIEKAEESLTKDENNTEYSKSKYSDSGSNSDSDGDFLTDVLGGFFVQIFAYSVYAVAFESPFEMQHKGSHAFINRAPYYSSKKGNYTYEWDKNTSIFRSTFSVRYISENSRLKGAHLNLDTRFLKRLGVEIDYLQLWENNPNFGIDNLAIYTALVKYHRVRTERFNAWWGVGASYIDGAVNQFGFTYGLGAELFFVKPLSLEVNFNQTLINNENVNKFNGLLNYHFKSYKFSGGYEKLKIGSQNFSTVTFGVGFFL